MEDVQRVIATVIVFSALSLIVLRHPMHCLMSVLVAIIASSALWLSMQADFLALSLLIMHAGAVMTLFLYVTMTLTASDMYTHSAKHYIFLVVMGLLWLGLLLFMRHSSMANTQGAGINITTIGLLLVGKYHVMLWVLGLMVTLAMVASIALIYHDGSASYMQQKPYEQKKVTVEQRLWFKTLFPAGKDEL